MKKDIEKEKLLKIKKKLERDFAKAVKSKLCIRKDFNSWLSSIVKKEKDIEKEKLDDRKLVDMTKGLKKDFAEVAKFETGKGNKFNFYLRSIMKKEIKRSRKNRPE